MSVKQVMRFGMACGFLVAIAGISMAAVDVAAARTAVLKDAEPAGAVTIAAAKAQLSTTPKAVVVAGRIGGRGTSPFGKNEATFSMLEIPTDDHATKPGHNADDCPFCKKRAANSPIAAVSFLGADGKVIPMAAPQLLGVAEGQDVVVSGSAIFDPKLGIPVIQIKADGLYIRPAK